MKARTDKSALRYRITTSRECELTSQRFAIASPHQESAIATCRFILLKQEASRRIKDIHLRRNDYLWLSQMNCIQRRRSRLPVLPYMNLP
ncbi:hypothetical protein [Coleofasciculus sp. FACHB-1120]|uniref:hypothetical protein n=1 Tax=Coleofasciculus sp. FACHB-1120 TaxID=2692783 RepID=UPI001689D994|nr:hypothetical protein [Coleofasciculus sp. FACHB-1120]MBD2743625.1 hypothetical protein [Coleofasciculus sp. FACHB-1120]